MKRLLIVGAGGLGQTVREIAESLGYEEIAFLDDAAKVSDIVGKCCDYKAMKEEYPQAVVAFGDNAMRLSWTNKLLEEGFDVPYLIHPSSFVSKRVTLEPGCLILPGVSVGGKCQFGKAVLVNSGAVIDHDVQIGDGAYIGLGTIVKSYCEIPSMKRLTEGKILHSTRKKIEGVNSQQLEDAIYAFGFAPNCSYVKPFGSGHINATFAVYMATEQGDELSYVLQQINTNVFKSPAAVMKNIFGVTEYLRDVIRKDGGNPDRETLSYIKTRAGKEYFLDDNNQPWRCYNFIPDSACYLKVDDPQQFYQAAKSFGHFLRQLGDYPIDSLTETIPDFHNTVKRFKDFANAQRKDVFNRVAGCKEEIAFVRAREQDCAILVEQQKKGILPLRVTHNDTKLNNILFDGKTGKGLCIIDLDTIMPGLAANDFGDAIRFGASTAAEDEPRVELVHFDLHLFEMYAKGYLEETKDVLTPAEIESLAWGARLLTLECGIRFLTDYLQGDHYFKTSYPTHNLVRARTQFKLVKEMEKHFEEMQNIVAKYAK